MNLQEAKDNFQKNGIFYSEDSIQNHPTVIAYDKVFKWEWIATQLNTFVVVTDYGDETIEVSTIKAHLDESFHYAKRNYKGWPRGLQSGLAVISVLLSSNVSDDARIYCELLKSGKKWSAFTVPVVYDTSTDQASFFKSNPMWGRIYYPYLRKMIEMTLA